MGKWITMEGWSNCVSSQEPEFYEMDKHAIDYSIYLCVYHLDYDSERKHHYAPWKGFIHTGILFNGIEYFVGPNGQINFNTGGTRKTSDQETTQLGVTVKHNFNYAVYLGKGKLENIGRLKELYDGWEYNMMTKNCNHFSIDAFNSLKNEESMEKVHQDQLKKIFEMNKLRTVVVTYGGFNEDNNPDKHPAIQTLTPPVTPVAESTPVQKFMESIPEVEISEELLENVHLLLLMDPIISSDQDKWVPYLKDKINQCNGNMDQFVSQINQNADLCRAAQKVKIELFLKDNDVEQDNEDLSIINHQIEGIIQAMVKELVPVSEWNSKLNKKKDDGELDELLETSLQADV